MTLIAGFCEWSSMVCLGNTDQFLRQVVQKIIRTRISSSLAHFIPKKKHYRLFELLESTQAAFAGGFVRYLMCLGNEIDSRVMPSQLSILVPVRRSNNFHAGRAWFHFISSCASYDTISHNESSPPYTTKSSKTYFFDQFYCVRLKNFQANTKLILFYPKNTQISIMECDDDNVLTALLHAPETSLFNVLTSRRFYSFYPSLHTRRINLETTTSHLLSRSNNSIHPFRFGFMTYDSASVTVLSAACNEGCYARTRNILKMEGIQRFRWGSITGKLDHGNTYDNFSNSYFDFFETVDVDWRIGSRCWNGYCPFYKLGFME